MTTPIIARRFADTWADRAVSGKRLLELGSPHFGVAPARYEITYRSNEARSHYVAVYSSNATEILGNPVNPSNGGGAFDRDQARISGIAETVERYCAAYVPPQGLVTRAFRDLDSAALDPDQFALFAPQQHAQPDFPYAPFTRGTETTWVPGIDLRAGALRYAPAQLVYLNRHIDAGSRIGYPTSNGLACGPNVTEALISGLFEAIERDAVMITWNAQLSMPQIDVDTHPEVRRIVARHFKPAGIKFVALDLTSITGVPVCMAIAWNDTPGRGMLSVGAAARATLAEACTEALIEAFHCTAYCHSLLRDHGAIPPTPDAADQVASLEDHVRYYGTPEHVEHARFLTQSTERVSLTRALGLDRATPAALIDDILRVLPRSIDAVAVDVTSPDVAETGLAVVKVLSPQLVPLGVGWKERYVGGRRIYEVPRQLGFADSALTLADLNPHPHPFP